jgi:hypothetical protein
MIGRLHLKIIFSIVLLAGLAANQSGLAKGAHAQHTGASAKRANSVHTKPAEGIDTSVTVLPPRGSFSRVKQNSSASLKIVRPENSTRRSNVTGAITSPFARNAIGQPVKSKNLTANAPHLAPSLQAPGTVANHGLPVSRPASPVLPLNVGRANVHPTTTASNLSNGRIDGARLIRPSVSPVGVGGPARARNGINGTTVQTKH